MSEPTGENSNTLPKVAAHSAICSCPECAVWCESIGPCGHECIYDLEPEHIHGCGEGPDNTQHWWDPNGEVWQPPAVALSSPPTS